MADTMAQEPPGDDLLGALADCTSGWEDPADWRTYLDGTARFEALAAESGDALLLELTAVFHEGIRALADSHPLPTEADRELVDSWPTMIAAYIELPTDPESMALMLAYLKDDHWPAPLGDDAAAMLIELAETPGGEAVPQSGPAAGGLVEALNPNFKSAESAVASPDLDPAVREMIDLLVGEIEFIKETLDETLVVAADPQAEPQARRDTIEHFAEQVERLGLGSEVGGLSGLHDLCELLKENLSAIVERAAPVSAAEGQLISNWCRQGHVYLHDLGAEPACSALSSLIGDPGWPVPADPDRAQTIYALLCTPVTESLMEDAEPRQEKATEEDVSLALPDDVDPELLDALLQELPSQTAEFSGAIQSLVAGTGSMETLDVAQRIAHTLKGAANTVGVHGLANLTHQLEDILLALAKHETLPGPALADALVRAADCLEVMAETLMGQSEPPADAVAIMQTVLDWANRIDREGTQAGAEMAASAGAPEPPAAPVVEAGKIEASDEPQAAAAPGQMVRVPAALVDDLLRLVGETIILNGQIHERVQRAVEQVRTMQGQFGSLQQLGAELERLIDLQDISMPREGAGRSTEFDPLEMDQYNELHTVSRRLVEAATDSRELGKVVDQHLTTLNDMLTDQGRLSRENQEMVLHTRMVSVQNIIPRIQRSVRQSSRASGKRVELECLGTDTMMDSDVINDLVDPLMHVLRNAVDHGIENEDQRSESGKDATGKIRLEFQREGNHIVVRCADDGAGLDWAKIREVAEARGMIHSGQALTEVELCQIVLRPGFSTRSSATQLSGRGIGMDVVHSSVTRLGGSLNIHSVTGEGCRLEIRLPVTLVSTHALLVRALKHVLAISSRGVEQILHPGSGEEGVIGDAPTFKVGEEIYPAVSLSSVLGLSGERRSASRGASPVLIVNSESGRHAVLVDAVLDSRDLVIKSLGVYLPKLRGVAGATILGDGSVTPVLDLPELLRTPRRAQAEDEFAVEDNVFQAAASKVPLVLVVDDSMSARRSLAQFMGDSGFQVRTARDGIEAIELLGVNKPDLLLVDLEMPRMNGLELTSHVRANAATQDIPVIMVTSRSTEKHRRQADSAGVDRYLTKPYSEDDLMGHVQNLCGSR